jgi:hypothetical protein
MRMHLAMACINHQPFKIRLVNQQFQQAIPHTAIPPSNKPAMRIAPSAEVRGEVSPRSACAHNPKDSIDEISIILCYATPTSLSARQMRLDLCPGFVRNVMTPMRWYGHNTSLLVEVRTKYAINLKFSQSRDYIL